MTNLQKRYQHHINSRKSAIAKKDLQLALVHNYFINDLKYAAFLCLFAALSGSSLPHYELYEIQQSNYI